MTEVKPFSIWAGVKTLTLKVCDQICHQDVFLFSICAI
jgi:hypothetical protein